MICERKLKFVQIENNLSNRHGIRSVNINDGISLMLLDAQIKFMTGIGFYIL